MLLPYLSRLSPSEPYHHHLASYCRFADFFLREEAFSWRFHRDAKRTGRQFKRLRQFNGLYLDVRTQKKPAAFRDRAVGIENHKPLASSFNQTHIDWLFLVVIPHRPHFDLRFLVVQSSSSNSREFFLLTDLNCSLFLIS
jgi:hypothetical protein